MKTRFGRCAQAVVAALSIVFLSTAEADSAAPAITLRPAEGRVWQTCLKPSEPIRWPWLEGSDAARLQVDSLCDGKRYVFTVGRVGDSLYGEQSLPVQPLGSERLYDLTLEYLGDEAVIATETARVAVIPGVDGGAITLRVPSDQQTSEWAKTKDKNPLFAYDGEWSDSEVETVTLGTKSVGASESARELAGTSGYDVIEAEGSSKMIRLLMDGIEAFASACTYAAKGMVLIIR